MQDMTEGSLYSHLLRYAFPLLLANWLQLLYNAADSVIAGRFIGKEALAAEGIASPLMNLVILGISGLCIGAGIFMSECYGAKDMSGLRKSLASVLKAGVSLSLLIMILGVLLTPFILAWMSVPQEIYDITAIYVQITFAGVPFTFIYNALSAAMKSVGDSRTPLRFLAVCSVLNIILDSILLGIFHFGIRTSALTTVICQMLEAALTARCLCRDMPLLRPSKDEWKNDTVLLKKVLSYGIPSALQQAVQPVGKLLIQSQVNLLGVSSIAAYNAVSRIDSFAFIPEQGIAAAIATCIAQNRGAGKTGRIRKGFQAGIVMELIYGIAIGLCAMFFGRPLVSLFVKGNGTAEVIAEGAAYLSVMCFLYVLPGFTNGFQGYCRGAGKIPVTILCTFIQISLRTLGTYLLAGTYGIRGIAAASGVGWIAMLAFEVPYVLHHMHSAERTAAMAENMQL